MLDSRNNRLARAAADRRFSWRRSIVGDVAHVAVGGVLDDAAVAEVDRALRFASAPADEIVLDLGGLEAMCFGGAKLIVVADHRIRRAGGCLSVRRGSSNLDWLLDFIDSPFGQSTSSQFSSASAHV